MSRNRPRFVPSSRCTDASSTRTRSSSKRGPMNRARTSFTGMPPQRPLNERTPLPRRFIRHEMIHVAQDGESARAPAVRQLEELSPHPLRPARDPNPFLVQLFLDPDMEVRDDEDIVRHEGGLIGDRLEIHVGSKGGSA